MPRPSPPSSRRYVYAPTHRPSQDPYPSHTRDDAARMQNIGSRRGADCSEYPLHGNDQQSRTVADGGYRTKVLGDRKSMRSPGFGGRQPRGGMELEPAWESPVNGASASSHPGSRRREEASCRRKRAARASRMPMARPVSATCRGGERSRVGAVAFRVRADGVRRRREPDTGAASRSPHWHECWSSFTR